MKGKVGMGQQERMREEPGAKRSGVSPETKREEQRRTAKMADIHREEKLGEEKRCTGAGEA